MKVNSLVCASDREAVTNRRPSVEAGSSHGTVIPSKSTLLPRVAILRYNSANRLWKATESSPFSSIRYSMNRAKVLGPMVSRKSATLGRGSSTSSSWKIYARSWCYLQDSQLIERTSNADAPGLAGKPIWPGPHIPLPTFEDTSQSAGDIGAHLSSFS